MVGLALWQLCLLLLLLQVLEGSWWQHVLLLLLLCLLPLLLLLLLLLLELHHHLERALHLGLLLWLAGGRVLLHRGLLRTSVQLLLLAC